MTVQIDDLTAVQWEAFDEFVKLIGEDRWSLPATGRALGTYTALISSGLVKRRPHISALVLYGLTDAGRREVCQRDGHHDFNKDKPTPDGCARCDAERCQGCAGFGSVSGQRGPVHTLLELRCRDCDGLGLYV